jgi:hypothetical protein
VEIWYILSRFGTKKNLATLVGAEIGLNVLGIVETEK